MVLGNEPIVQAAVVIQAYMAVVFVIAAATRRNDLADVAWGLGFAGLAWWSVWMASSLDGAPRRLVLAALVSVWALRLATHIARRNFRPGSTEDSRYAAWRRDWGRWWLVRSYLQVFVLQGLLLWVVALPIEAAGRAAGPPLAWLDAVGVMIALAGMALEWIGDAQLARWLADPAHRGQPLESGAWAWTRHPNYFGDAMAWWGFAIVALSVPGGALGLVGALAMTLLLRFVSGVPLLEARHTDDSAWRQYRARTSVFVPRPPRKRR